MRCGVRCGAAWTGVHGGTDHASTNVGSEYFGPGGTLRRTMEPERRAASVMFGAFVFQTRRVRASVGAAYEHFFGGLGPDGAR